MLLLVSSSYSGRIEPPGMPAAVSIPCISSNFVIICAPVFFIFLLHLCYFCAYAEFYKKKPSCRRASFIHIVYSAMYYNTYAPGFLKKLETRTTSTVMTEIDFIGIISIFFTQFCQWGISQAECVICPTLLKHGDFIILLL